MHSTSNPHRLWALNAGSRTGQICEYDLRKMESAGQLNQNPRNQTETPSEVVSTFMIKDKEEITSGCLNLAQDTLLVGLADGNIKQIDLK